MLKICVLKNVFYYAKNVENEILKIASILE